MDSLQQKREALESGNVEWSAKAHQHGEELETILHHCTTKEEISEVSKIIKAIIQIKAS